MQKITRQEVEKRQGARWRNRCNSTKWSEKIWKKKKLAQKRFYKDVFRLVKCSCAWSHNLLQTNQTKHTNMLASIKTSRVSNTTPKNTAIKSNVNTNRTGSIRSASQVTYTSKPHTTKHQHTRRFCASPSSSTSPNSTTHFGFQSVPVHEKASKVHEVFASVAHNYDVMNDLMSAGVHRYATVLLWSSLTLSTRTYTLARLTHSRHSRTLTRTH